MAIGKWLRVNWGVIAGVATVLFIVGQQIFAVASQQSEFRTDHERQSERIGKVEVRQEKTDQVVTNQTESLIRIETRQEAVKDEMGRMRTTLDRIDTKLDGIRD